MCDYLIKKIIVCFSAVIFLFYQNTVQALDWKIRPSVTLEEVFSDNINLSSSNKKSALVTELTPAVSVSGKSAISTFDFNYRMQNFYNAAGDSGIDINSQLQMNTLYELVRNRFFVDSSSSISQQNISNRRTGGDNVSSNNNSTTVSTFRLSPYWTPHFKGFADGFVRLSYDRVDTDGGTSELSKTNSFSQNIRLTSGHDFSYFSWSLEFNNSNRSNSNGSDVNFQNSSAEIRYAIGRDYSVFGRVGHSSNSFASNSNSSNDGISYTFGGQWKPSKRFRVEAGYGNNTFVTVELSPFNRLRWITTYSHNDIGLNTGDTWDTSLNYTSRRSTWNLSYNENTVTTQQLLLDQQIFSTTGPLASQSFRFNTSLPTLTDEVFVTKRAALTFTYRTGKSNVSANVFRTLRTFEQNRNDEEVIGLSASWNWNFIRRMNSIMRVSWQQTESDGVNAFSDNRFDFSLALRRSILARLNANLEYRYIDQSSNDNQNDYSENRITASLSYQF